MFEVMGRKSCYSRELPERAVRMVLEHQGENASPWAATASIASKIGGTRETPRNWVRPVERDAIDRVWRENRRIYGRLGPECEPGSTTRA